MSNLQLRKGLEEKGGDGFIVAYGRSGDVAEERVLQTRGDTGTTSGRLRVSPKRIRMKRDG